MLNASTCKHEEWTLRVLFPQVARYSYTDTKTKAKVQATRFECVLVGAEHGLYCPGIVPWNPRFPDKAKKAEQKFAAGSVWKIRRPSLDSRAKAEYMGCPVKYQIILDAPSELTMVVGPSKDQVATHIVPPLKLDKLPGLQHDMAVDLLFKVAEVGVIKTEVVRGKNTNIGEAWVIDETGFKSQATLWDDNASAFASKHDTVALVLNARVKKASECNGISVPRSASVLWPQSSLYPQLAGVNISDLPTAQSAHSVWEPESRAIDVSGEAVVLPCGLLAAFAGLESVQQHVVVQVNAAHVEVDVDSILTNDGQRLWTNGKIRDRSGQCSVGFTASAFCGLFRVAGKEEAVERQGQGRLVTSLAS